MLVKNHLFKNRVPLMNSALDAYALRQKTIAKNITNVNTPNYIPEKVRFEEEFHREQVVLRGIESSSSHLPVGDQSNRKTDSIAYKADVPEPEIYHSGETHVNIDKEMGELARNQIRARFASQMLSKYFKGLNSSITGQATAS